MSGETTLDDIKHAGRDLAQLLKEMENSGSSDPLFRAGCADLLRLHGETLQSALADAVRLEYLCDPEVPGVDILLPADGLNASVSQDQNIPPRSLIDQAIETYGWGR